MPKKGTSLGKSLLRAHKKQSNHIIKDGYRHTSDLPDGRDFGRLNLKSITEQTSLDDFLDKTAVAQTDYIQELCDVEIVKQAASNGILTEDEKAIISSAQSKNKEGLCIPRRPYWDSSTSKEELDAMERELFLTWRRNLALLKEQQYIELTPYEKNLEVWRQLWRVIERSDVVVQIMDARNPLLFRCPDLEAYVKEVDKRKKNVLLLNKADFLTEHERKCWCDYFDQANVQIAFFSALEELNRPSENEDETETHEDNNSTESSDDDNCTETHRDNNSSETYDDNNCTETRQDNNSTETYGDNNCTETHQDNNSTENVNDAHIKNSIQILSRENLVSFLKSIPQYRENENVTAIGLVGYPNVGKSSTINAILQCKKVSVSATPGKTKHFQTFIIEKDLCLCDCPGLVFPNFVSTKAEMVINGILPIDQLTSWMQPVSLVTSFIPKHILESTYSILISMPGEGRDLTLPPTAEEFLNAHGYSRGFMTQRGLPDNARSSRYILKDFVNGKLLYCHAPPGIKQEDYHQFPDAKSKKSAVHIEHDVSSKYKNAVLTEADKKFFRKNYEVHTKGKTLVKPTDAEGSYKPWKKHHNRNKKEKGRRLYKTPYE